MPAAPVHTMGEAVEAMERAHPDGWVVTVDGVRVPPPPIHLDGTTPPIRRAPPRLGEHTAEVLAELAEASHEDTQRPPSPPAILRR